MYNLVIFKDIFSLMARAFTPPLNDTAIKNNFFCGFLREHANKKKLAFLAGHSAKALTPSLPVSGTRDFFFYI